MSASAARLSKWAFDNKQFDPDWYAESFPDVGMLDMDPATHYRRYGSVMGRAPNAALADAPEQIAALCLPAPKPGRELLAAHEIALTGAHTRAIHYAQQHLPTERAYTVEALKANQAVAQGDMASWLKHLNNYLTHFDIAPLQLEGEGDNVLARLSTAPVPPVTGGPLISVIMPAWNAEKTIAYAINSILQQSWQNFELLIVDDASEDKTWSIIQGFAARDSRIRAFRNPVNVGPYVSKNVALTQAKGEWITGHDADDWAHPERLARQVAFCNEKNVPASLSSMLRLSGDGQLVRLNPIGGFVYDGTCRSAFISLIVHAQYFHDLLGFWDNVRVGGDSELLRRIERLERKPVPQLATVTMLCLDNPEGLTNHAVWGRPGLSGASSIRIAYRSRFKKFHHNINRLSARFDFLSINRRFDAPASALNAGEVMEKFKKGYVMKGIALRGNVINSDVAIVTNLRFPGGNASSTLDEVDFFVSNDKRISVIHCPTDKNLGRPKSERYDYISEKVSNWSRLSRLSARVVIIRHPAVFTSHAFSKICSTINAESIFVVINNSCWRPDGTPVYDRAALIETARKLQAKHVTFCPIGPDIRAELEEYRQQSGVDFTLSKHDWTPTFDLNQYQLEPAKQLKTPFRIGRHGRDGAEKWHQDADALRLVYPEGRDFQISILGGAKNARRIMGSLPENWTVHEFGEITPRDYLSNLDIFAYFPNTNLVEAFGRTTVEAMLAARPVILPPKFAATFDDLPIYAEPEQVEAISRELAEDDAGRIAYLTEVQKIATARYSSPVIARRMAGTGLNLPVETTTIPALSPEALRFKHCIERAGRK